MSASPRRASAATEPSRAAAGRRNRPDVRQLCVLRERIPDGAPVTPRGSSAVAPLRSAQRCSPPARCTSNPGTSRLGRSTRHRCSSCSPSPPVRDPSLPRSSQNSPRSDRSGCDPTDIDARTFEHAAGRAEVVLHVDHEDGCSPRIDLDGLRSRFDGDHSSII
jgi:hypothetical protein